jgi:hypothetical protein
MVGCWRLAKLAALMGSATCLADGRLTVVEIALGLAFGVVAIIISNAMDNLENAAKMPHKAWVPVQVESGYEVIEREDTTKMLIESMGICS